LLNQLNSEKCDLSGLGDNELTRAGKAIDNANKLGAEKVIVDKDITSGNSKLNLLFTAEIYNACHGLEPKDEAEQKEQFEKAKLLEEKGDPNDTREERCIIPLFI
jgi:plastin-1